MSLLEKAIEAAGRCPVCGWPLTPDGCRPGNCSYRPEQGSQEYQRIQQRKAEIAQAEAAEFQRQQAECVIWLEENRDRIYCITFGIFVWTITLTRMSPRYTGKTLHEAIQAAREAEKQPSEV